MLPILILLACMVCILSDDFDPSGTEVAHRVNELTVLLNEQLCLTDRHILAPRHLVDQSKLCRTGLLEDQSAAGDAPDAASFDHVKGLAAPCDVFRFHGL